MHKKDANSLRPIAVGETFRRLVAKCLAFKLSPQASPFLEPHQLGVKTQGGCEAIIHSAQAILSDTSLHSNDKWLLQVDFRNAFNTMDRGVVLSEVRQNLPGLSAFAEWCYRDHSILQFGDMTIASASGPQQGDPLGCILFAIGHLPLVKRIQLEVPTLAMHSWYLDDGTFIGRLTEIAKAFQIVKDFAPLMGLSVSMAKSTYWRCPDIRGYNLPHYLAIPENTDDGLVLLGASIGRDWWFSNKNNNSTIFLCFFTLLNVHNDISAP